MTTAKNNNSKKKKLIASTLLAPTIVSMIPEGLPLEVKEASAETVVIEIRNATDLQNMRANPAATYQLMNDIDLTGVTWNPFDFNGVLEGNGHSIKNLTLTKTSDYSGLFATINGGQVKDVIIDNFKVTGGNNYTGTLAGRFVNGTTENVQVKNSTVKGTDYVGLLFGEIYEGSVNQISTLGTVEGRYYVGGLSGKINTYYNNANIQDVYTNGSVKGTDQVGGIVGLIDSRYTKTSFIANGYSAASVEGRNHIGGAFGRVQGNHSLTNIYGLNTLVQGTGNEVGKVIGHADLTVNSTTLIAHEAMKGNTGPQFINNLITQSEVEEGLVGFEDETVWKQDLNSKLPIFVSQLSFEGDRPTYETYSTTLSDEKGFFTPIYTVQNLRELANNNIKGYRFKLMNDLDFTGESWNPYNLVATLEGNDKVIKNLTLSKTSDYTGLFSQIDGGTVKDLTIEDFQISGGNNYTGALAGRSVSGTTENIQIKNSKVKGTDYVGLLYGEIYEGTVKRVSALGTAEGRYYIGGLSGKINTYYYDANIQDVYTNGSVKGTDQVGGIIGLIDSRYTKTSFMANGYSAASVEGRNHIGGAVGRVQGNHSLTNIYGLNNLVQGTGNEVGKVIGHADITVNSTSLNAHQEMKGNTGPQFINNLITQTNVEEGLEGFGDETIWKQDSNTNLPIFVSQSVFDGTTPTFETFPTTLSDEKGFFTPIYTVQDLREVANNNINGYRFKLMNDLDFTGENWTPFNLVATLEGNDKVVKNLTFSKTSDFTGLFSQIEGGSVKDLTIENFQISGGNYTGTLAGRAVNGTAENIQVKNSTAKGNDYVGLLFGEVYEGTVKKVSTLGTAEGRYYIGGLSGKLTTYYNDARIQDVYTNGSIKGTDHIGGIAGLIDSRYTKVTYVTNAYSTASVQGRNNIGGDFGSVQGNNSLVNIYALNDYVNGTGNAVGKVIGQASVTVSSTTLNAHESLKGNAGNQFINHLITASNVESGLIGFENVSVWKQDETSKLPIFINQNSFEGILPTYDEKPRVLTDEQGIFNPIYTVEDLQNVARNNVKGYRFKLMNDLDLTGVSWNPIDLMATIEGNDKVVRNLTLSRNAERTGLFATISGGTVKDLTLENFNVNGGASYTGALAGRIDSLGTVENVQIKDSSVKGIDYTGLLAGDIHEGRINNVSTQGSVEGRTNVGGLGGRLHSYYNDNIIQNVYTNVSVTGSNQVGGIGGLLDSSYTRATYLSNIYSTSSVQGTNNIGGILGRSSGNNSLTNIYALNNLVQGSGSAVGKAIGAANSINSTTVTVHEAMKGNGGSQFTNGVISQPDVEDGMTGFEDETIWKQDDVTKLPIFLNQNAFEGELPTYESKTTVMTDEKGIFNPIYTVEDLQNVARNNVQGYRFKLMNDLDFTDVTWNPIDLIATIEGNDKVLKNLSLSRNAERTGLFATISGGTVKDLTIENFNVNGGASFTGVLAGRIDSLGTVENIQIKDSSVKGIDYTGLLAGDIYEANINKVSAVGSVEGRNIVGGLGGRLFSYYNDNKIKNVYTNGTVKGNEQVGGIGGLLASNYTRSTYINNVYSTSDVQGTNHIGGILGRSTGNNSLTNVYALNNIVQGTGSGVGKAVGTANSINSETLIVHEAMKGNGGSQFADRSIAQSEVELGLVGFEDEMIWKQDIISSLPIFLNQDSFEGSVPTYDERPTVMTDEKGIFNPIYTVEDLQNVARNNVQGYRFKLMNDLDFTDVVWNPIDLMATIEGNDKVLRNLTLSRNAERTGLFATISGGTVRDLTIENFNVNGGASFTGALAGRIDALGAVENVQVKNSTVKGIDYTGLLAGDIHEANINKVSAVGSVEGRNVVGGLGGRLFSYYNDNKIQNVYVNGTVKGNEEVGGIGGRLGSNYTRATYLTNVYSTASVQGVNYVGGILGRVTGNHSLTNIYALNNSVQGTGIAIGKAVGAANSINSTTLTAHNSMKGNGGGQFINKTISQSEVEAGMAGFEDESIWKQDGTTKHPIFLNQNSFDGTVPTYESKPTLLSDANGLYNPIYTVEDLQNIARNNVQGYRYKLMNDLDFTDVVWNPIDLTATLEGNNKVLKSLTLSRNAERTGLFATISGGTVKDLTIENFNVNGGASFTGVLAGRIDGLGTIENVQIKDSSVKGIDYTGLLAGDIYEANINKVSVVGFVEGRNVVGGLGGRLFSYYNDNKIRNVYTNGTVKGNEQVGGIGGVVDSNYSRSTILNSVYSASSVQGANFVGGVLGRINGNYNSTNVYALNNSVQGTGNSVGKAVGLVTNGLSSATLTAHESIKGNAGPQGIQKVVTQSQVDSGMSGFEDTSIWKQDEVTKLPIFVSQDSLTGSTPTYNSEPSIAEIDGKVYSVINNATDLSNIRYASAADYILGKDIDLEGVEFAPIPDFSGTLDGRGNSIKNLTINAENQDTVGLFGVVTGKVKNLQFEDSNIKGNINVGILAGQLKSPATIQDVTVEGTITGLTNVGGLAGYTENSIIDKVFSLTKVRATNQGGGIVGFSNVNTKLTNSYAAGDVDVLYNYAGGLIGYGVNTTISGSYASNVVEAKKDISGGLIGFADRGTITNSFAINPMVKAKAGSLNVGRVVGKNGNATYTNVYAHETMAGNFAHSLGYTNTLTDEELRKQSTFESLGQFNFDTTWAIDEGISFPYFQTLGNWAWDDASRYGAPFEPIVTVDDVTASKVMLDWNDVNQADSYIIKHNGIEIGTTSESEFTVTGLTKLTSYTFEVIAVNENGQSDPTSIYATTLSVPVPTNLEAEEDYTDISLSWKTPEQVKEFIVKRDGVEIARIPANEDLVGSYQDEDLTVDTLYQYEVFAVNDEGDVSEPRFIETATLAVPNPEHAKAENVKDIHLDLTWDDVDIATEYIIFQNGEEISRTNETSSHIEGLSPKTAYKYEIVTVSQYGNSVASTINVTTQERMQTVKLNWFAVDGAVKYRIERSGEVLGTTIDTSFTDHEAIVGKQYAYRIIPIMSDGSEGPAIGFGNLEVLANDTEDGEVPLNFDLSDISDDQVVKELFLANNVRQLQWEDEAADNYEIYRDGILITTIPDTNSANGYVYTDLQSYEGAKYAIYPKKNGSIVGKVISNEENPSLPNDGVFALGDGFATIQFPKVKEATSYEIIKNGEVIDTIVVTGLSEGFSSFTVVDENYSDGDQYEIRPLDKNDEPLSSLQPIERDELAIPQVTATNEGDDIVFNWYAIPGAAKYLLYRDGELVYEQEENGSNVYQFIDPDLDKNKTYSYEVVPVKADESLMAPITIGDLKLPIVTVELEKNTGHVLWLSFQEATRYRVQLAKKNKETGLYENVGASRSVTGNTLDYTDLQANENYQVIVTPLVNNVYDTKLAEIAYVKTPEVIDIPVEAPAKIENLNATLTDKTINLTWDAFVQNGVETTKYRVQMLVKDETTGEFKAEGTAYTVSSPSFTSNALPEGKEVKFEVIPMVNNVYPVEHSTQSNSVVVPVTPPPAPVTNPQVKNVNATLQGKFANVSWDTLVVDGKESTKYRVQMMLKDEVTGEFKAQGFAQAVTGNSFTSKELQEDKEYRFDVIPMVNWKYENDYVGSSNSVKVTSTPPAPVVTPKIENAIATLTGTSAMIQWDPFKLNGVVSTRYRVQTYIFNEETSQFVATGTLQTVSTNSVSIEGLEEGKKYKFEVIPMVNSVYKEDYKGITNEVTTSVTPQPEPEEVPTYEVRATVLENKVALDWDDVKDANGYRVEKFILDESTGQYVRDGFGISSSKNSYIYSELKANTTYKFKVTPRVNYVYQNSLAMETTATIGDIVIQDQRKFVPGSHVIMTANNATVRWEPMVVNGEEITRYRIQRYVLNNETGEYELDLYAPAVTGTSYTDTYARKGSTYRYEITPMSTVQNKYLFDYTTTVYDVSAVADGETKIFFDITSSADESTKTFSIQRYIENEIGVFEIDGEPFVITGTSFLDSTTVSGKKYRYSVSER